MEFKILKCSKLAYKLFNYSPMRNKLFILFVFTTLSFFVACEDEKQNESQLDSEKTTKNDSLLSQQIKYPKNEIKLSQKAQEEAEKWMLYVAMESEVKRMKNYTLDEAMSNAPSILRASDTLMKTVPKKFSIKPIESRIKVLHTKASVFHQLSNKQQKDLAKLKEVAEEIPVDFFNLNIQLNEIFLEMPEFENLEQ